MVLVALIVTVKHDSVKFLVTKGKTKEARQALCLVYKNCNMTNVDEYIERIRSCCGSDSTGLTIKDALVDPQYRRATWTNIGYIMFHELTGIMVVIMYSNFIF